MITTPFANRSVHSPVSADITARSAIKTTANSFQNNLNEALAVRKLGSPQSLVPSVPQTSSSTVARQGIVAARRNLVASSPVSQAVEARVAATAKVLIATKSVTPTAASEKSSTTLAQTTSTAQAAAAVTPMSPGDVVASILQQNPMPSPYAGTSTPSMDPGVYSSGSYIEQSNLNFVLQQVNHENQNRFDEYKNGLQNWAAGGMQGAPPAPPKYEAVDVNGFDQWWNQYTANVGVKDAPSVSTFVSNMTV